VIAVLFGLALGYLGGRAAFFGDGATGVLLLAGFTVTPIPVCVIAARRWVWVSVIPVVAMEVTLLASSYLCAYKPIGTDLQTYLHTLIYPHWFEWLLWWTPAIIVASACYAIKSRRICPDT